MSGGEPSSIQQLIDVPSRLPVLSSFAEKARMGIASTQGHGLFFTPNPKEVGMYQTLYRKYRPQTFSEIRAQERVTAVLQEQSRQGTLTHAYLFSGTRGTGKTSCARILAKAVNCEHPKNGNPCNECATCKAISAGDFLDVQEVDAASVTGVDNIRKLCEDIAFLPSRGRKRVFIIDEVHMLSASAWGALLKTLEEPPEHALFILATTELTKVPATIRSRCQCFVFCRISVQDIADAILDIAKKEDIPLEQQGALFIARLADGALRDALSLLELCVGEKEKLSEQKLQALFGIGDGEKLVALTQALADGNAQEALAQIDELHRTTNDLKMTFSDLLTCFRDMLLVCAGAQISPDSPRSDAQKKVLEKTAKKIGMDAVLYDISVLESLLSRFDRLTVDKKMLAELCVIKMCHPALAQDSGALAARVAKLEALVCDGSQAPPKEKSHPEKSAPKASEKQPAPPASKQVKAPPLEETPPLPEDAPPAADPDKAASASACPYAQKLIDRFCADGREVSRPLLSEVRFSEEGTTLVVSAQRFSLTLLKQQEQALIHLAKEFNSQLQTVELRLAEEHRAEAVDDLSDF